MNPSIEKLMAQVYELEGLLLVVANHGSQTASIVYDLIHEKANRISELAQEVKPDPVETEAVETTEWEQAVEEIEKTDFEINIPQQDSFKPDVENIDLPSDFFQEKKDENDLSEDEEVEGESAEENFSFEDDYSNQTLHDSDEEANEIWQSDDYVEPEKIIAVEEPEQDKPRVESNYVTVNFAANDDDDDIEVSSEIDLFGEESDYNSAEIDEDEYVTVDEVLQRNLSKDLSKIFSINDKFRYRRELFGNSDVEFQSAIDIVATMDSYAEAEEYFYGDLEWDKDSPEVVDFMTVIKNHFS